MTILSAPPTDTFRQETANILTRLRAALGKVMSGYSMEGQLRSRDLQKRLGIDTRLSWQIARIVNSENPLDLSPHIPSPVLLKKALSAARKNGTTDEAITAVNDAYAAFEHHIHRYAGDRASFDAIMARLIGGETDTQLELNYRRSIFEGHRYLWGIELDHSLFARILHPSLTTPKAVDCALIRLKCGLRRIHNKVPIVVDIKKYVAPAKPPSQEDVIDTEAFERYGMPIIPAFCSPANPDLRSTHLPTGGTLVEYVSGTVGKPSTITVAFGDIDRNTHLHELPSGEIGHSAIIGFGTPTRVCVHDLLIHRATFGRASCEISRLGHAGYPLLERKDSDPPLPLPDLPCHDEIAFLGSGEAATHLSDVPQYSDLLRYTCEKAGWNIEDFDVYRVRMEYPVLDTLIVMDYSFSNNPLQ